MNPLPRASCTSVSPASPAPFSPGTVSHNTPSFLLPHGTDTHPPSLATGNILVRLLLPPTLLVASAPYFLPHTSANVRAYLSRVEDTHFPDLAAQHRAVNAQLHATFSTALHKVEHVGADVGQLGGKVVHAVEEHTGLRLGEVIGRAREVGEDAVREFSTTRAAKEGEHLAGRQQLARVAADPKTEVVGVVYEEIPVAVVVAPHVAAEEVREELKTGTVPVVGVKEEKRLV